MSIRTDNATFVWVGDSGLAPTNESISLLPAFPDNNITPINVLFAAVQEHSLCLGRFLYYTLVYNLEVDPPGVGANVDRKAVIYFRDPATLEALTFTYPAPIAADVEDTQWGKRIKKSVVDDIVGHLSTMAGKSYTALYGVFLQRV